MKFKKGDKIIAIKDYISSIKEGEILTIKESNRRFNGETSYKFEEILYKNYNGSWLEIEDYFILAKNEMRKLKLKRILNEI